MCCFSIWALGVRVGGLTSQRGRRWHLPLLRSDPRAAADWSRSLEFGSIMSVTLSRWEASKHAKCPSLDMCRPCSCSKRNWYVPGKLLTSKDIMNDQNSSRLRGPRDIRLVIPQRSLLPRRRAVPAKSRFAVLARHLQRSNCSKIRNRPREDSRQLSNFSY